MGPTAPSTTLRPGRMPAEELDPITCDRARASSPPHPRLLPFVDKIFNRLIDV